jgi:hypothetical protein
VWRRREATSRRGSYILGGGILAGLLLLGVFIYAVASHSAPAGPRPPELGGQQVPEKVYEIHFDQKYDLYCSLFHEAPTTYRSCKILGFTGRGGESVSAGRAAGSSGFAFSSGSGSASSYAQYFDHWLVLELPDGRLAYIPPNAVKYIEEAKPAGE